MKIKNFEYERMIHRNTCDVNVNFTCATPYDLKDICDAYNKGSNIRLTHIFIPDEWMREGRSNMEEEIMYGIHRKMTANSLKFQIKKVIFNGPATIVFWEDGTKTVIKRQPGDIFDPEKAIAMCIAKKALGNKSNFNNVINKALKEARRDHAN